MKVKPTNWAFLTSTLVSESIWMDIKDKKSTGKHIGRGFYRAGTYQLYLLGDHLAKWFTETATVAELRFTVPSNELDIRALNLGFMISARNRFLGIHDVKIKNLTSMWEWTLSTPSAPWVDRDSCEVTLTWLSHWRTVEEHREIKPGDLLHIFVGGHGFDDLVITWGTKILYEEEQQQVDEDVFEQQDDGSVKQTDNSWSDSSSRSQTMNYIDKTTTSSIDWKRADQEEEEGDGSTSVAIRYNNVFRSPLDLSVYQSKRHTDHDEDLNHKPI